MEKYRLILVVTILVLTVGRVGTAAATRAPPFLLRGSVGEEQGIFEYSVPALSATSCVTLDKLPNFSEPHVTHLTETRRIPTSQGWCEDYMEDIDENSLHKARHTQ